MADLQSSPNFPQSVAGKDASENAARALAFCLSFLNQKSPDLALLVERWDALPEVVRAGIMAMVKASMLEGNDHK
jgi:hypothetical protein